MKTILYSSLMGFALMLAIIYPFAGYSQVEIKAEQVTTTMSFGEKTGFQVIIPQALPDDVKKAWIKQIQQGSKSKALETAGEISINGALIKDFSPDPMDVYALISTVDSNVKVVAFFVIDSAFFDPEKAGNTLALSMEDYMENFAKDQYELAVENELKMEEGKLKDLNKQLSDLQKSEEKMEGAIKDEENKISKAEEEINILEAEKAQQMKVIEEKRVAAATVIDKDAKKAANSEIKTLEKERTKSDKALDKEKSDIDTSKGKIKDYEDAIEAGKEQQQELQQQIEQQEEAVQRVEEKLKGIK